MLELWYNYFCLAKTLFLNIYEKKAMKRAIAAADLTAKGTLEQAALGDDA